MRADARRNREAILGAARATLALEPEASMGAIAARAGVGRVTLYGHFCTRTELIDAVFETAIGDAERILSGVGIQGDDPHADLAALARATWHVVGQTKGLLVAAQECLTAERIRELHDLPLSRVQAVIRAGQRCGAFRADLPESWLLAVYYSVMHCAVEETVAGRLTEADAPDVIVATLTGAFSAA